MQIYFKRIGLKNIYSGEYLQGILDKYEKGNIFLSDGNVFKMDRYEIIEIKN